MKLSSTSLEKLVERIHRVLEPVGAHVKWNGRLTDPDTGQLRQVDVLIRREGKCIHVECRAHEHAQDVKWIEELIGRRQSLKADQVIAVSTSGFSKPAENKANTFGIVLRTLTTLSGAEIAQWAKPVQLIAQYIKVLDVKIALAVRAEHVAYAAPPYTLYLAGVRHLDPQLCLLERALHCDSLRFQIGTATMAQVTLQTPGLRLGLAPILTADVAFKGRLVVEHVKLLGNWTYANPRSFNTAEATVARFTNMEIIQGPQSASLSLDLSDVVVPDGCLPYLWEVDLGRAVKTRADYVGVPRLNLQGMVFGAPIVSLV